MDESRIAYNNKIHFIGRITMICVLLLFFSVPVVIILVYKPEIDMNTLVSALLPVVILFAPISLAEVISYYTILGSGACYIGFTSGNVTNMKVPATISGMDIVGAKPGSEEGQIIAILASGTSTLMTTAILFLGMLFLARFIAPVLQDPVWKPAFDNLMPSLFGAIAVGYFVKDFKITIFPFVMTIVVAAVLGLAMFGQARSYILLLFMLLTSLQSYFMYKKGWLTKK